MKKSGGTFAELRELLCELGFVETSVTTATKTVIRFEHACGTILLFRAYRPNKDVYARDTLVVRRQLIDNGLIEESSFDLFLHKATA